jgi:Arm DNA-binding domain
MGEDKVGEVSFEAKGDGLTAAKVKTAKPGKYHDGGGTGLFLRVDLNGGRFWIQRIVIQGKRREIGLGGFPVVGLAEAQVGSGKQAAGVFRGRPAGRAAEGTRNSHFRGCC